MPAGPLPSGGSLPFQGEGESEIDPARLLCCMNQRPVIFVHGTGRKDKVVQLGRDLHAPQITNHLCMMGPVQIEIIKLNYKFLHIKKILLKKRWSI